MNETQHNTVNSSQEHTRRFEELEQHVNHSAEKSPLSAENIHTNEALESIRHTIEEQATSIETIIVDDQTSQAAHITRYITKHIKDSRYQETLQAVRHHLTPTQKVFSRFIHQPTIETASEIGSKTIARPSGLLGGSLLSLLGSLTIVIIARRVGFSVPNSMFAILFIIGFGLGIVIELLLHRAKSPNS